jgi:isoleucyl-tRNA synthetase
MLVKRVKPDFRKLGPRYGKIMKQLAARIQQLDQQEINTLEQNGSLTLLIDAQEAVITTEDVEILSEDIPGWLVGSEGGLTIALDITLTPELEKEGVARELVNRIQNLRKAKAFEITDRITIHLSSHPAFDEAVRAYAGYICNQVLADELTLTDEELEDTIEIDDQLLTIRIEKNS